MSLVISGLLLCVICGLEGWRRATLQPFGLLSVANIVFALNFCIPPFFIAIVDGTAFETNLYGERLFIFKVIEELNIGMESYSSAVWVVVIAYIVMVLSYYWVSRVALTRVKPLTLSDASIFILEIVGVILAIISIGSIFIFSSQFTDINPNIGYAHPNPEMWDTPLVKLDPTGLLTMLKFGMTVRADFISVKWGFLHIVALLGVPAVIFITAAAIQFRGLNRWVLFAAALVVWLFVFTRNYYAAGRLELTIFMALIPMATLLNVRSLKIKLLGIFGLVLFGAFMGLASHSFFTNPVNVSGTMATVLFQNTERAIVYLLNEFSFPYVMSANAIQVTPEVVNYRYFVDPFLAILYMLPSPSGVDYWPEMISHIHNRSVPLLMPYDLVSFGYYSLGIPGVVVVFVLIGGAFALLDRWLTPGAGWLVQCLRAAWMLYLPFRIMYADPYTAMKTGFGLIIGTAIVLALVWWRKRREVAA